MCEISGSSEDFWRIGRISHLPGALSGTALLLSCAPHGLSLAQMLGSWSSALHRHRLPHRKKARVVMPKINDHIPLPLPPPTATVPSLGESLHWYSGQEEETGLTRGNRNFRRPSCRDEQGTMVGFSLSLF